MAENHLTTSVSRALKEEVVSMICQGKSMNVSEA